MDLDLWPLDALVLRTPGLELRPDDDAGLRELVALARQGVHPPEQMPFVVPWTDAEPAELGTSAMRFHWRQRAALSPRDWTVQFLVRRDGRVIGEQSLASVDFATTREVVTGSWVGARWQGQGYGTEMRAAVLAFAFEHLGATCARSAAFVDNPASLTVSAKLGYRHDGSQRLARRGRCADQIRLVLSPEDFAEHRPGWRLDVTGADGCRALLGVA
jgi:RimJ/RimL family protein N-acetyltransferase